MGGRYIRTICVGLALGATLAGSAVAGIGLRPPPTVPGSEERAAPTREDVLDAVGVRSEAGASGVSAGDEELTPEEIVEVAGAEVEAPAGGRLPAGTFLVGAARASLAPSPELFGGGTWQTEGCASGDTVGTGDSDHVLPDPAAFPAGVRGWPGSSPDCIYLGGFDIGPIRAAERVGTGGVWVRALAVSNGETTFVYGIADTVGWFAEYDPAVCADCGIRNVREELASGLGVDVAGVIFGSTHTHAGADTYGGWGGIPDWYREQIRDAAVAAAKQAIVNLQPATITTGEVHLRHRNNERRDTYYSTVDTGATWLQATTLPSRGCGRSGQGQGKPCEGRVIATLATFAGHPTIVGDPVLHADWPGAMARQFETLFGGVGIAFEGGLGNASVSGTGGGTDEERAEATGIAIADDIAAAMTAARTTLISNDMAAAVQDITHPVMTNPGLVTLGAVGLFDRAFAPGSDGTAAPAAYYWSKRGELSTAGEDNDPEQNPEAVRGCASAGPAVVTTAGAHRVGEIVIAFAPGEIFSNIAEVVKERADGSAVTMVLGQTNDALGYIIQSFEFDEAGTVVTEYGTRTGEYEEVFSIDRCFGDHVLETLLESTQTLGFGR